MKRPRRSRHQRARTLAALARARRVSANRLAKIVRQYQQHGHWRVYRYGVAGCGLRGNRCR